MKLTKTKKLSTKQKHEADDRKLQTGEKECEIQGRIYRGSRYIELNACNKIKECISKYENRPSTKMKWLNVDAKQGKWIKETDRRQISK